MWQKDFVRFGQIEKRLIEGVGVMGD